jgi:hypothetical protein
MAAAALSSSLVRALCKPVYVDACVAVNASDDDNDDDNGGSGDHTGDAKSSSSSSSSSSSLLSATLVAESYVSDTLASKMAALNNNTGGGGGVDGVRHKNACRQQRRHQLATAVAATVATVAQARRLARGRNVNNNNVNGADNTDATTGASTAAAAAAAVAAAVTVEPSQAELVSQSRFRALASRLLQRVRNTLKLIDASSSSFSSSSLAAATLMIIKRAASDAVVDVSGDSLQLPPATHSDVVAVCDELLSTLLPPYVAGDDSHEDEGIDAATGESTVNVADVAANGAADDELHELD